MAGFYFAKARARTDFRVRQKIIAMEGKSMTDCLNLLNVRRFMFGTMAGTIILTGVALNCGCKNIVNRAQSPDEPMAVSKAADDEEERQQTYIGQTCHFWGATTTAIEGLTLVTGLNETGSNPSPSKQRADLIKELASRPEVKNAKQLVADMSTEVVLIRGRLPPGIRKGEPFDIEIQALRDTEATSLEGGTATQCRLRPQARLGRSVKQGHVKGLAKGKLITDSAFSTRDDESTTLRGIIPGGGIAAEDRDMGLKLTGDTVHPKTTTEIARAINKRFTVVGRDGRLGAAEAKTDRVVNLLVPDKYKLNVGRYIHVLRNLAYSETSNARVNRMELLDQMMSSPADAERAALRLEALGRDGQPALKRALSNEDAEVRFHAAQALAYQDQSDGAEVLKLAARDEPAFRALALTALATLDSSAADEALNELLNMPSAETRYGAFFALRAKPSQSPEIAGEWVGDSFHLHEIESNADPMLHFSKAKRAEIVVFDGDQTVSKDFLYVGSGLTVRAISPDTLRISRYRANGSDSRKKCSTRVIDLITTLADEGVGYGEMLKMFREAKQSDSLNSRLVVHAMPRSDRDYVPGETSDQLPPERSEKYIAKAAPTLFQDMADRGSAGGDDEKPAQIAQDAEAETIEQPPVKVHKDNAVRKASAWSKISPFNKNR